MREQFLLMRHLGISFRARREDFPEWEVQMYLSMLRGVEDGG
jgi:hypothetical protein